MPSGLYEQGVNIALNRKLSEVPDARKSVAPIDKTEESKVLLFVREFKADRSAGGAAAYTFLETANDVKHSGSRPVNITWGLYWTIPAKFLKKTNKLVVG